MLEFEHVSGKGKRFGLKDVSFSLPAGYIMGLIGKNGAGKTTLLHYILGDHAYSGSIRIGQQECFQMPVHTYNEIAFVSEECDFFWERTPLTNGEILGTLYEKYDKELFEQLLRKWEVPWRNRLRNLSRGELMKFQMAFAMAHGAKIYLLDEVTAGMDPVFRLEFYQILREIVASGESSVLLTTHLIDEIARNVDYVGKLEDGRMTFFGENFGLEQSVWMEAESLRKGRQNESEGRV